MTFDLKQMIADQQARLAAYRAAQHVVWDAEKAYREGSQALTKALIEASGYKVGQIVKTTDGSEMMISHIRLTDDQELIAACQDRTGNGTWSKRSRRLVKLNVKIEEAA